MTNQKKRVAIIGSGVVGASAAFYLSKTLGNQLDIYDEGTGQATSAAAGIISPWLSRRRNKPWYRLVKAGAALYPEFLTEAGVDIQNSPIYKNTGALIFKSKFEYLEEVAELAAERRKEAPEIGETEIMNTDRIKELIPIYEGTKPGLFVSGGSRVDGHLLVEHLQKAAENNGAVFSSSYAEIEEGRERKYRIKTNQSTKEYDAVILAVGAWLPNLLEPFGYKVDIRPQKGQLAELEIPCTQTGDWPVIMPEGEKDILFFPDGRAIIGATHEDDNGYDLSIEPQLLKPMIEEAAEEFSSVFKNPLNLRYRSGTRAYTSDYASFIGEVPGMESMFTASGLGSTGLTAGPIVGKMLAQLILGEKTDLPLEDYPIENYIQKINPAEQIL